MSVCDRNRKDKDKTCCTRQDICSTPRIEDGLCINKPTCKRTKDEIIKSVYRTDYDREGFECDYKDFTKFKFFAVEDSTLQPLELCNVLKGKRRKLLEVDFETEYMDNFNKTALDIISSCQLRVHPLLSWRKRFGDCKL